MKNADGAKRRDQTKAKARELYTLASKCQVPMLRACRRIKMATSTPHRWLNNGSDPDEGHMAALRGAILRIAAERETLPDQYRAEFAALGEEAEQTHRPPLEIAREVARSVAELEQSLAATGS